MFDFFGKNPKHFQHNQYETKLEVHFGNTTLQFPYYFVNWYVNYLEYMTAYADGDQSFPMSYSLLRFDVVRPLHHGSYDYVHELLCCTLYSVDRLLQTVIDLINSALFLLTGDVSNASFFFTAAIANCLIAAYLVVTSSVSLVSRPIASAINAIKPFESSPVNEPELLNEENKSPYQCHLC